MCGLGKLNAAALDTTVACGYNGTDQHNIGLLPPIAGIDIVAFRALLCHFAIAPIAGIDTSISWASFSVVSIAPHCGD